MAQDLRPEAADQLTDSPPNDPRASLIQCFERSRQRSGWRPPRSAKAAGWLRIETPPRIYSTFRYCVTTTSPGSSAYCPLNAVDAAERPLHRRGSFSDDAAAIIALVVAAYFLLVAPIFDHLRVTNPVSTAWALLLFVPAAVLAARAWQARHTDPPRCAGSLGSAACVAGALVVTETVREDAAFASVVVAGLAFAGVRALRRSRARW